MLGQRAGLTRNEQKKKKETKYGTARSRPHAFCPAMEDSSSHFLPPMQSSMISCQFSPVAHLKEQSSVFRGCLAPCLSRDVPEQKDDGVREGAEVVVPSDLGGRVEGYVAEDLHPDDGEDEEEHPDEQDDVRQGLAEEKHVRQGSEGRGQAGTYLEGLDEGPEQNADGVPLAQELDETRRSEQTQEAQTDEVVLEKQETRPEMKRGSRVGQAYVMGRSYKLWLVQLGRGRSQMREEQGGTLQSGISKRSKSRDQFNGSGKIRPRKLTKIKERRQPGNIEWLQICIC